MSIRTKLVGHTQPYDTKNLRACAGFSLLEMLISVMLLLVIAGGVVSVIGYSQKSYAGTELKSDMYENVRGVAETMEQEIGQAGLVSLPGSPTLTAAAVAGTNQTLNVPSTSMFVGEQLLIDAGPGEELVTVATIPDSGSITVGTLSTAHAKGAPVSVLGALPNGIMPPGATDGSTSMVEPSVSIMNLFGDINGDGSLVYVRYTCDTSTTPGMLTRSVTTITPGNNSIAANRTLLSTLIPNPGNTPCFTYTTATAGGFTFVTNVSITISVQGTKRDPQTGAFPTMTKSFLYLAPRNVLAAYEQAQQTGGGRVQPNNPPNVTLY